MNQDESEGKGTASEGGTGPRPKGRDELPSEGGQGTGWILSACGKPSEGPEIALDGEDLDEKSIELELTMCSSLCITSIPSPPVLLSPNSRPSRRTRTGSRRSSTMQRLLYTR
jgi:hypothetical protein